MTVTSSGVNGNNDNNNKNNNTNNNNNNNNGGGGEAFDNFPLFANRTPIWSTPAQSALDQHWNESILSPVHSQQHRLWSSEPFSSDLGSDELPYPRQTSNHNNNDFSHLPSSPAALSNGNHLSRTGCFQFPNDSSPSSYYPQQLPPIPTCLSDSFYDPSPLSALFPGDIDRRNNPLLDSRQQQQSSTSSLENQMISRESKLALDQMVERFADLRLPPPPAPLPPSSTYSSYQNQFLPPINEQQQILPPFYCQQSSPTQQIPPSMINSRLPPPFGNHLYLNSPSSPLTQNFLAPPPQQQQQQNGPLPTTASTMFNDRYERNDGYLPFANNSSYLPGIRFSPNTAYRTTKSGKQQIGPENSNLFICHLPQETNDQSLMNLFSQFGKFDFLLFIFLLSKIFIFFFR